MELLCCENSGLIVSDKCVYNIIMQFQEQVSVMHSPLEQFQETRQ